MFFNVHSHRFFGPNLGKLWLMFKKHCKIGIQHIVKANKDRSYHFEGSLSGPSRGHYLGQVGCNINMANLAQIMTPEMFARNFFSSDEIPIFIVFSTNCVKKQTWPR